MSKRAQRVVGGLVAAAVLAAVGAGVSCAARAQQSDLNDSLQRNAQYQCGKSATYAAERVASATAHAVAGFPLSAYEQTATVRYEATAIGCVTWAAGDGSR